MGREAESYADVIYPPYFGGITQRLRLPCSGTGTCDETCQWFRKCHCGCGGAPKDSTKTDPERGYIKGQPYRYVRGHVGGAGFQVGFNAAQAFYTPIEEVWGIIVALEEAHGISVSAAKRIGLTHEMWWALRTKKRRWLERKTVAKLERAFDRLNEPLRHRKLPVQPLRKYVQGHTASYERISQAVVRGNPISELAADEYAISLGLHPSEVWPEWNEVPL